MGPGSRAFTGAMKNPAPGAGLPHMPSTAGDQTLRNQMLADPLSKGHANKTQLGDRGDPTPIWVRSMTQSKGWRNCNVLISRPSTLTSVTGL